MVVICILVIVGAVIVIVIYRSDIINIVIFVIESTIFSDFISREVIYIKKINSISVNFCNVTIEYFLISESSFFIV